MAQTTTAIATENLYLAAFARTNGATPKRLTVSHANGRDTAVFELECPWADRLSTEYYNGTAVVNLAEYREHLEKLKDELFDALRRKQRRRDHVRARARQRRVAV